MLSILLKLISSLGKLVKRQLKQIIIFVRFQGYEQPQNQQSGS